MSGFIAVLMLDTAFPRIVGDVGNPASYPFPVRLYRVTGADVPDIVRPGPPDTSLVAKFIAMAQKAEGEGAIGILTSCGFLAYVQADLARAVTIPVMASSLFLAPLIKSMTGCRPVGILTADATALTSDLLRLSGFDSSQVVIAGLQDAPAWRRLILASKADQNQTFDPAEIGALVEAKSLDLLRQNKNLGAILMECTNLPPYAEQVTSVTGLPVFHILQAAHLIWNSHEYLAKA